MGGRWSFCGSVSLSFWWYFLAFSEGGGGCFPRFLGFRGDFTWVFGIGCFRGYFLYFSAVVIRLFGVSGVLGGVFWGSSKFFRGRLDGVLGGGGCFQGCFSGFLKVLYGFWMYLYGFLGYIWRVWGRGGV